MYCIITIIHRRILSPLSLRDFCDDVSAQLIDNVI